MATSTDQSQMVPDCDTISINYNSITTSFSITSEVVFFATLYISVKRIAKSYRKRKCANA